MGRIVVYFVLIVLPICVASAIVLIYFAENNRQVDEDVDAERDEPTNSSPFLSVDHSSDERYDPNGARGQTEPSFDRARHMPVDDSGSVELSSYEALLDAAHEGREVLHTIRRLPIARQFEEDEIANLEDAIKLGGDGISGFKRVASLVSSNVGRRIRASILDSIVTQSNDASNTSQIALEHFANRTDHKLFSSLANELPVEQRKHVFESASLALEEMMAHEDYDDGSADVVALHMVEIDRSRFYEFVSRASVVSHGYDGLGYIFQAEDSPAALPYARDLLVSLYGKYGALDRANDHRLRHSVSQFLAKMGSPMSNDAILLALMTQKNVKYLDDIAVTSSVFFQFGASNQSIGEKFDVLYVLASLRERPLEDRGALVNWATVVAVGHSQRYVDEEFPYDPIDDFHDLINRYRGSENDWIAKLLCLGLLNQLTHFGLNGESKLFKHLREPLLIDFPGPVNFDIQTAMYWARMAASVTRSICMIETVSLAGDLIGEAVATNSDAACEVAEAFVSHLYIIGDESSYAASKSDAMDAVGEMVIRVCSRYEIWCYRILNSLISLSRIDARVFLDVSEHLIDEVQNINEERRRSLLESRIVDMIASIQGD